ncbi:MAG: plastocyanin [Coxiella sp. (in: Bacteria)]|nr:MAG: plastocyanin [Coxiella sp. (in: g-proteobacteria)]
MTFIEVKNRLSGLSLIVGFLVFCLMGSTSVYAESASKEKVTIEIKKFAFIPAVLTVSIGTTVRWINAEKRQYHSVWFESLDKEETDYFFPEETYERTFNKVGTYHYRCGPHERMKGTVIVENDS